MKNQPIQLEKIEANFLPELQGLKEKQLELVNENPFIEINDTKSYTEAKSRRTALVSGRTAILSQDKVLASKLKEFRSRISDATKELISISLPHEEKQQSEVKRWEQIKADEKAEKLRLEEERKEVIEKNIQFIKTTWVKSIKDLKFGGINSFNMSETLENIDLTIFEEFQYNFLKVKEELKNSLQDKINSLTEAESQRVERENLKKEREENDRKAKELEEREAKIKAEQKEKQAAIDAENEKKAKELAEREAKIKADQDAIEKEKAEKLEKSEAKKQAKIEEENRKKQEARLKALAPDKDKIIDFVESLEFSIEAPVLEDEKLKKFLSDTVNHITNMKNDIVSKAKRLK